MPNSAGREYRTICHNTYAYRVRSGKQYTFTRSEDIERFTAEVGYYIGEDYWGQGIMSAALSEAVEDYFKTTEVVRLFATPFDYNKASAKVLEKAGFTLKCIFTKGAYKNGQFVDMLYYERIK